MNRSNHSDSQKKSATKQYISNNITQQHYISPTVSSMKKSVPRPVPNTGATNVTPTRTKNNNNTTFNRNRRNLMTVDIVTGKELVYIYFDYTKIIQSGSGNNLPPNLTIEWLEENQYTPASIVKEDVATNTLTVKLINGEVIKVSSADAVKISSQDDSGVKDILHLKDFSEKNLIYTLRVRYNRDKIYTFVGPILISLNPYKYIENLYSVDEIFRYHNQDATKMVSKLSIVDSIFCYMSCICIIIFNIELSNIIISI